MDYIREYRNFINSYYFAEGLRITIGVTLPAIVLNYAGHLDTGLVVSLGALCISVADIPGPIKPRRNGMLAGILLLFIISLIAGLLVPYPWLMGALIAIFCFLFSMAGVYGARVNSIGISALLVMVLSMYRLVEGSELITHALLIVAGGAWYMMLSLGLYSFRPYRLVQQALGESIMAVASYLKTRSSFYRPGVDYDRVYTRMMEEQVSVQQKQLLVRELLFKSRNIIKESTTTGRTLLMIFIDSVDLFEKTTTSIYSYEELHRHFDRSGILESFRHTILELAAELEKIGTAVQRGIASEKPGRIHSRMLKLQKDFKNFADSHRTSSTLDALLSLKKILQSLEDVAARIQTLHHYTRYDKKIAAKYVAGQDYQNFVEQTNLDPSILLGNLRFSSNIFRHALRVSIATTLGYVISQVINIGHSYWILLTIIVILKPAYSITRTRNYERLFGTIGGAAIGFLLIYLEPGRTWLFVIMLFLMTGSYSFMRTRYLLSVIFMTPYILILFYLLGSGDVNAILRDRIIDTAIGSVISFVAIFIIAPTWEREQIGQTMKEFIESSREYYLSVCNIFRGLELEPINFKLQRKKAFVSLANLSEAFNRMLAEPKRRQKNSREVHQFVVMSHMLNSHIASLAHLSQDINWAHDQSELRALVDGTVSRLENAANILHAESARPLPQEENNQLTPIQAKVENLLRQRWQEIEEGKLETDTRKQLSQLKPVVDQLGIIYRIASDMEKVSSVIRSADAGLPR